MHGAAHRSRQLVADPQGRSARWWQRPPPAVGHPAPSRRGADEARFSGGRLHQRTHFIYFGDFCKFLADHKDELLAVVGDLNIGFEPRDCTDFDGKACTTVEQSKIYVGPECTAMLEKADLVDAWSYRHPGDRQCPRDYTRATELIKEARKGKHGKDIQSGSWARVDHVLVHKDLCGLVPEAAEATIYSSIEPH